MMDSQKSKKILVVVDMQNDFITGALGSPQAVKIVPNVKAKISLYHKNGDKIIFTRDTHQENYLDTHEGQNLPVPHCIQGTDGHSIADGLHIGNHEIHDKPNFGSMELADRIFTFFKNKNEHIAEIELVGLCTDVCVIVNALILKTKFPETKITVDSFCCAGITEDTHNAALAVMKMCHINIIS